MKSNFGWSYYLAAGRSLAAVEAHLLAVQEATEAVQSFVMLCGAERAFGGTRIGGLRFSGALPVGWMPNPSAPLMAIPDPATTRGISLQRKMNELRIPDNAEFGHMIGADPLPNTNNPNATVITLAWPSYERLKTGWVIKCPLSPVGRHTVPPDAMRMTRADYERLSVAPSFNLMAFDSENSIEN